MATINQLSAADALALTDLIAVYSSSNGDARKASLSLLVTLLLASIDVEPQKTTQYSAPTATGFTAQVQDADDSIWFVISPAGNYAAGTVKLPAVANCTDKQEVLVNCSRAVTVLTVDGNGATVVGAPTALVANDYFRLRFDAVTDTWYRVG